MAMFNSYVKLPEGNPMSSHKWRSRPAKSGVLLKISVSSFAEMGEIDVPLGFS